MKKYFANEVLFREVAALLKEGRQVTIPVRGQSMRPFLADGRDSVTLVSCTPDELTPGVVVLVREDKNGYVVLHRIIARQADRLVLQGDGNAGSAEYAYVKDVLGMAVVFIRKGRSYPASGMVWRMYSSGWRIWMKVKNAVHGVRGGLAYLKRVSCGFRKKIVGYCLLGLLSVSLSLGFIGVSKWVIDAATGTMEGSWGVGIALLAGLVVLQLVCDGIDNWMSVGMQVGVGNRLRHRLFARLLQSRWNAMEQFHTGDVMNRIEKDVSSVVGMLTVSLPSFVVTGMQLLAAFVFFCFLDARLPWVVVGVFPLFLWIGRFYLKRMYRYTSKIRKSDSRIQSIIQESLQLRSVIKALEQNDRYIGKLDRQQKTLQARLMQRTRFSILTRTCVSAAFAVGYLIAFVWGTVHLHQGLITFGTMAAFLQLVGKVQRPILDMARMLPSWVEVFASIDRLRELEALPQEREATQVLFPTTPDVVVDKIDFGYDKGEALVFQQFSYCFQAGSRVAVMGETGRGKTTLVRLLLAFAVPQSGNIRLCTTDWEVEVSAETRCNFTYVPQGNTLFSGTIRDNLLMGNPEATEEDMVCALHTAVAEFVFDLPSGMDTLVGEQGSGLSEGQAQRIAIARALLRPAFILLFDEATSALDADTELRLLENLKEHCAGKTFIFVTHHTAVAERCDAVLRLDV